MSQEQEDLIIAMITQAEEAQALASMLLNQAQVLQNQAEKTQNVTREILAAMPAEILRGAAAGARGVLQEATEIAVDGLKASAESLQAAAAEGRASAGFLRRTGIMQGFFLVVAAVVLIGLVHFVAVPVLSRGYAADLADTKVQVAAEKATLAKLRSETWQLELVEYEERGMRGIILPKGVKVSHYGPIPDDKNRVGIVIKP